MQSSFRLLPVLAASGLLVLACGSGDPDSSSSGSSGVSSTSSSGSTTTSSSSGSMTSTSSSSGAPTCQDFKFGSSPYRGDVLFGKCDTFPPTNCKTGGYLWLDDTDRAGSCFCRVDCDDFNPPKKPGADCGGGTLCVSVKSATGTSKGDTCMPPGLQKLNLCK
jgi:hypothetical protein